MLGGNLSHHTKHFLIERNRMSRFRLKRRKKSFSDVEKEISYVLKASKLRKLQTENFTHEWEKWGRFSFRIWDSKLILRQSTSDFAVAVIRRLWKKFNLKTRQETLSSERSVAEGSIWYKSIKFQLNFQHFHVDDGETCTTF